MRLGSLVSAHDGLQVTWTSAALGGVDQLGYQLDNSPTDTGDDAAPAHTLPAANPLVLPAMPTFDGYIHVRAKDHAGHWSAPRRRASSSASPAPAWRGLTPRA